MKRKTNIKIKGKEYPIIYEQDSKLCSLDIYGKSIINIFKFTFQEKIDIKKGEEVNVELCNAKYNLTVAETIENKDGSFTFTVEQ